MKSLTIGLLAHVDAGKTSLSEAILYESGNILNQGKVDNKNSFFDFNKQERERGITIFSKQAIFNYLDTKFTMIDTPGHIDFSCEMERTLKVLDLAIVVINAQAGAESHTYKIMSLLDYYHIPTIIFINKMDIAYDNKDSIINHLKKDLKINLIDFREELNIEEIAMSDDSLLDKYLNNIINLDDIKEAINQRKIIPTLYGSATKNEGISKLLEIIDKYAKDIIYDTTFKARIFKINYLNNTRLTHLKITGGSIRVKSILNDEKIDEIRYYNGQKYTTKEIAVAGDIVALKGLKNTLVGDTFGYEEILNDKIEPYLNYVIKALDNTDLKILYTKVKELEDEDPSLNLKLVNNELHISLMGEIQIEILKKEIKNRFNIEVDFTKGSIEYKESIKDISVGVGHFEPLRHYAEVHLLLEPLEANSGLIIENKCVNENIAQNYQRLVISLLTNKELKGILANSSLMDMRISLLNIKYHLKHTEGGDIKEATYRALRQGLSDNNCVLLEPYADYALKVNEEYIAKALYDLDNKDCTYEYDIDDNHEVTIKGIGAIKNLENYHREVIAYTKATGKFNFSFKEYRECRDATKIIKEINYDYLSDINNPSGSIFCANGAGFYVSPDKVKGMAHLPLDYFKEKNNGININKYKISDNELNSVLNVRNKKIDKYISKNKKTEIYKSKDVGLKNKCYVIDGYNIIYSDNYLKEIAKDALHIAREKLIDMICNYKTDLNARIILVFDAYNKENIKDNIKSIDGVNVVYTKYQETADMYIEKNIKGLLKDYRVYVVSSDHLIQSSIFMDGAFRVSSASFMKDLYKNNEDTTKIINKQKYGFKALAELKELFDEE